MGRASQAPSDFARRLGPVIDRGFSAYVSERDPRRKLALLAGFRVLCAHRRGDLGAQTLNRWVEERLADRAGLNVDREFYDGRPLLDHAQRLPAGALQRRHRRRGARTRTAS